MLQSQCAVASLTSKHLHESWWTQLQQSGFEQSQIRSSLQTWSAGSSSHWCPGESSPPQLWQGSSLFWSLMGETLRGGRSEGFLILSISTSLCFIRVCCFSPFTEAASYSQWSHLSSVAAGSLEVRGDEFCCFLARNSALLLAFLRRVEGLAFFLMTWLVTTSLLLVSKEKEKEVPKAMEMLKVCPCLASAWQKSSTWRAGGVSQLRPRQPIWHYFWTKEWWYCEEEHFLENRNISSSILRWPP